MLSAPAKILEFGFLACFMLSIGMQARPADLRSVIASRSLLARVLIANFVLVPLLGIALARLLPIPTASAGALLLLACTPGDLTAIKFTKTIKSEQPLAVGILLLLCVLAVVISPALMQWGLPRRVDLVVPYGRVLAFIALIPVLSLAIGMFVRSRAPGVADRLAGPVGLLGLAAFIALMIVLKSYRKEAVASIGLPAAATMLGFILLTMAIGWILGGPKPETRQILATTTSIRNIALCLVIAESTPRGDVVITPLIAFSLLIMAPNMVFTVFHSVRRKRAARAAKAAGAVA